jgi:hypothetical protein
MIQYNQDFVSSEIENPSTFALLGEIWQRGEGLSNKYPNERIIAYFIVPLPFSISPRRIIPCF